jgi:hypothetical protein
VSKNYWFKFEWLAWLNDRDLSRCSLETQGFWLRCICLMEEDETSFLEGTIAQIANLLGCSPTIVRRCINELEQTKAATIERPKTQKLLKNQGFVKVVSRRLVKRYNLREYNRLAKRKERSRENVKPPSNDSSKDIEFKSLRESPNGDSNPPNQTTATKSPPPSDPRRSHPAMVAMYETTGVYPPKPIWDDVIDALGIDVDIGRLKDAYRKWLARGYNKTNYDGVIDWYLNGVPKQGRNHGTNRRHQQQTGTQTAGERILNRRYRNTG